MDYFNTQEALYRHFQKEIRNASSAEIETLKKEIKELKDAAQSAFEEQLRDDKAKQLELKDKELKHDLQHKIALKETKLHQILVQKRSDMVGILFAKLTDKMKTYQATKAYQDHLISEVSKLDKKVFEVIFISQADAEILKDLPFDIRIDNTLMGGFKALSFDKKQVLDQTFNSRLIQAKAWFFDHASWFI